MSGLGRFLEVSVQTADVPESLNWYKMLGFAELTTGDMWSHKYAVVSDGVLCIGLHDREFDSPAITFVQPDLARHAAREAGRPGRVLHGRDGYTPGLSARRA